MVNLSIKSADVSMLLISYWTMLSYAEDQNFHLEYRTWSYPFITNDVSDSSKNDFSSATGSSVPTLLAFYTVEISISGIT